MSTPARGEGASRRLRRDLRAINGDGVAFSVMVGAGETYLVPFALAVGVAVERASLLATLPILAGALFQLTTARGVRRLGSYRRWVVACAALQALCFVPLVVGALAGRLPAWLLFVIAAAYWGTGMATTPAWNAWVSTIVPRRLRPRYFARRSLWAQLALLGGIVLGGYALEWGKREEAPWLAFALLFGFAGLSRMLSARFLAAQSEAPGLVGRLEVIHPLGVLRQLRGSDSAPLLGWLLAMQVVVNIAAPFFAPYMLGPLALSYDGFMLLTAASFVSRAAILPLLGHLAANGRSELVLRLGALGIAPLPALWLVSDDFVYLLALQTYAGCAWAAVELATLLGFFDRLPQETRTSVLAVYNLGSAAAVALGSLLGAALFVGLGGGASAYAALFTVSSLLRLATLPLLRRVVPIVVAEPSLEISTLAVRPSAGAVQRPIVSSVEPPEDAGSA